MAYAYKVFNGLAPIDDEVLATPYAVDMNGVASRTFDMVMEDAAETFDNVQAVWVDNADNASPLTITFLGTGQRLKIPANAQGMFPVIAPAPLQFNVATAGNLTINLIFMNAPQPLLGWYTV